MCKLGRESRDRLPRKNFYEAQLCTKMIHMYQHHITGNDVFSVFTIITSLPLLLLWINVVFLCSPKVAGL